MTCRPEAVKERQEALGGLSDAAYGRILGVSRSLVAFWSSGARKPGIALLRAVNSPELERAREGVRLLAAIYP